MLVARATLAILILLLGTAPRVLAAKDIPANVRCGDNYWLSVDQPSGWSEDTNFGPLERQLVLTFLPPVEQRSRDNLRIIVTSTLPENDHERDVRVDIRGELDNWVASLHMLGPVAEILPYEIDHPKLQSAGQHLRLEHGSLYAVFLDPRSGRGNALSATLMKRRHPIEETELALFERTIASIDFDPRRGCAPDVKGAWKTVNLPGPLPAAAAPPGSAEERGFDKSIAFKGCGLEALFVPIICSEIIVEGHPALLASFGDGPEPAKATLESFMKQVARPFCFEAGRYPEDAPRLVFYAENDPAAHEYDCEKKTLGRALPPPKKR